MSPPASRTANGIALPCACMSSAAEMWDSTCSGAGTLVYHRRDSSPAPSAARRPSQCPDCSGSSVTCWPRRVGATLQWSVVADMSVLQRRRPPRAVLDAAFDLVEPVHAVPEHLPLLLLDAAVGLGVVERVDRIAVARPPEQARV